MTIKDADRKPIKGAQLADMDQAALEAELAHLKEAKFRLQWRSATETIENPIQFRMLRRNIARIATALRQRARKAT
ncbi:MAG TPA: 50S ribosomal protein L29 [Gemmatimonadales bacterium]|jgi:ribosomal protein L29